MTAADARAVVRDVVTAARGPQTCETRTHLACHRMGRGGERTDIAKPDTCNDCGGVRSPNSSDRARASVRRNFS